MNRIGKTLMITVALVTASACGGLDDAGPDDTGGNSGGTSGNEDTTYDHDNSGFDPFQLIDRLQQIGPPRYSSRVHSCPKVRYDTIGRVLTSLGVNVGNATNLSAGQLYRSGSNALGAPNYPNRIRENLSITTSGASRLFDIFAAAADEVIANVPNLARCQVGGVGAQLFDANNACRADGITCIIGMPATAAHIDFCNITVTNASSPDVGRRLAVAAMLAAAYTCE
jgi:hypothetical protein